jgi:hypothetical protein
MAVLYKMLGSKNKISEVDCNNVTQQLFHNVAVLQYLSGVCMSLKRAHPSLNFWKEDVVGNQSINSKMVITK